MNSWFEPAFTRFECAKYTTSRIVTIKGITEAEKGGHDFFIRGIYASTPDHINLIDGIFGPEYSMYVSGYTYNWRGFISEHGLPPSLGDLHKFAAWRKEVMTEEALNKHILTKDLVFECDYKEGFGIAESGAAAIRIADWLASKGWPFHVIFSGRHGYHVIVEDCEKYFKDYGIACFGRSIKSLAYAAIELAQKCLDEIMAGEPFTDILKRGREYAAVSIHFSPMLPQGLRKAAYSVTEHGTVCLPTSRKDVEIAKDSEYYKWERIMRAYAINRRGWRVW